MSTRSIGKVFEASSASILALAGVNKEPPQFLHKYLRISQFTRLPTFSLLVAHRANILFVGMDICDLGAPNDGGQNSRRQLFMGGTYESR
jgi:hypothetical protein